MSRTSTAVGHKVVVIGAGPAGLTAAYHIQKLSADHVPEVYEASDMVGGISRTKSKNGNRFDIGGHRFFTKVAPWSGCGTRCSATSSSPSRGSAGSTTAIASIDYPLKLFNALSNIGAYEGRPHHGELRQVADQPGGKEDTFEQWVINRFGGRLYMHFFRSYTEKVWGIPPARDQGGLGGTADQEPVALQGGLERDLGLERYDLADRGVPVSAARPGHDVGTRAGHGAWRAAETVRMRHEVVRV